MGLRYLPVFTGGTLIHEYLKQDQDVIRAGLSMLWMAVLGAILLWSATPIESQHSTQRRQVPPYQISPKPCWVDGVEGTCMFVWECIKSEGYHIGMCVDTFMFGSCCAHNNTENTVLPQHEYTKRPSVLYTPPSHQSSHNRPSIRPKPSSSRPHHSTKKRPSSQQTITLRPHVISTSINLRTNISAKIPTQPPRHSMRPMSTDSLVAANSIHIGHYTNTVSAGWQATTEPGFITSMDRNSIQQDSGKQGAQWQFTTEPGFVTRFKIKPSSNKPKPTKKPFPGNLGKNSTKHGNKVSRPTMTPPTTTVRVPSSTMRNSIVDTLPDVLPNLSSTPDPQLTSTAGVPITSTIENKGCGKPAMAARPQTRIVGGKDAAFGRWPWQVSVRRTSFFGFSSTHRCGGAILNENWIATAGHCVDDLLTSQIRIRVGEYDFSNAEEELPYVERAVTKKIVHPKYNFFTYEYDLALVQLDKALEFAAHISPICLPASDDLLIGENATVTGWGRLSEGGTLPSVLQEVQVPIVSNDHCKSMFLRAGRHEYIPEIFLCAGHETGGQDSCQGDSGGPLQVRGKDGRYFLAGIISWGIGCAEANLPGVCTRISKFVPWILKNVT